MAPIVTATVLEANSIDEIISIRADQIDMGERLRPIDEAFARGLGAVMAKHGQQTPIEVCRLPGSDMWRLVTGGHRVVGARIHDIEYIRAIEVGPNLAERRMREVSENLWRRDLDPIDRAMFVAELVALHKAAIGVDPSKDGRVASANARWRKDAAKEATDTKDTMSVAYGWNEQVATAIGVSAKTIARDLLLYRGLAPSIVGKLRAARHHVATNASQLRALTKLDPHDQDTVVTLLLRDRPDKPAVKTVAAAIAQLRGSNWPHNPEAKRLSTFIGTFERMSLAERKGAIVQLAGLLPAGFTLAEAQAA